jgi:hypothetical protein
MTVFKKHDGMKPSMEAVLTFPEQLSEVGKVYEYGTTKYGKDNWKSAQQEDERRMLAAIIRHVTSYGNGEETDPETGSSHLAHAITNALFLMWLSDKRKIRVVEGQLSFPFWDGPYIQFVDTPPYFTVFPYTPNKGDNT